MATIYEQAEKVVADFVALPVHFQLAVMEEIRLKMTAKTMAVANETTVIRWTPEKDDGKSFTTNKPLPAVVAADISKESLPTASEAILKELAVPNRLKHGATFKELCDVLQGKFLTSSKNWKNALYCSLNGLRTSKKILKTEAGVYHLAPKKKS